MKNQLNQLKPIITFAVRYRALLFFVLVAAVYGYVIVRINTFNKVTAATPEQATAQQVSVSPNTVQKIEDLQDNSVSVKALFDQARQNPFQE